MRLDDRSLLPLSLPLHLPLLLLLSLPFWLSFPQGICFCLCFCFSVCHSERSERTCCLPFFASTSAKASSSPLEGQASYV